MSRMSYRTRRIVCRTSRIGSRTSKIGWGSPGEVIRSGGGGGEQVNKLVFLHILYLGIYNVCCVKNSDQNIHK
jgi:hypothetical protein